MKTTLLALGFALSASTALAANVSSITSLEFGPGGMLFLGDGEAGTVHALATETIENSVKGQGYNLDSVDQIIADLLGTTPDNIRLKDLAIHPESHEAYIAVARISGDAYAPALVAVNQKGDARLIDTSDVSESLKLPGSLTEDFDFFGRVPVRSLTITDLTFHDGRLYAAGLSNADFASTLWTANYPFGNSAKASTVEIFHTNHGQQETRAPIRTMMITEINGAEYLIAAYTCTPLVAIPLSDIEDGAHINGKVLAELGYGNTPIDLLSFTGSDFSGNQFPVMFLSNKNQAAQVIDMQAIAEAAAGNGLMEFMNFQKHDLGAMDVPMTGLLHVAEQDDYHLVTLRRDIENGDLELVSFMKNLYMRLSDFESEYEFPGYEYPEGSDFVLNLQNQMKQAEGFPELVR